MQVHIRRVQSHSRHVQVHFRRVQVHSRHVQVHIRHVQVHFRRVQTHPRRVQVHIRRVQVHIRRVQVNIRRLQAPSPLDTGMKKKGGDIDILILSDHPLSRRDKRLIKIAFYNKFGEQKLDLVYFKPDDPSPFKELALMEGVEL